MKLRYTDGAVRQIEEALRFIAGQSPQGAQSLNERIEEVTTLLQAHPFAARVTSVRGVRRFVVTPYPYAVFYRVIGNEVVVTRFRHTSRRPLSKPA